MWVASAYQLVQYHFHAPSEHTVNGTQFPMEMHLVHRDADGQLAVIGVLIVEGAHNAAFDPIWANLPERRASRTTWNTSRWMLMRSCQHAHDLPLRWFADHAPLLAKA